MLNYGMAHNHGALFKICKHYSEFRWELIFRLVNKIGRSFREKLVRPAHNSFSCLIRCSVKSVNQYLQVVCVAGVPLTMPEVLTGCFIASGEHGYQLVNKSILGLFPGKMG